MKNLIALCVLMCSFGANASLLSYTTSPISYGAFESVFVEVSVSDINPDTATLLIDLDYDLVNLLFVDSVVSNDSGSIFSDDVYNNSIFTDASDFAGSGVIKITVDFLDDFTNSIGTSFSLVTLEFLSFGAGTSTVSNEFILALDAASGVIEPQLVAQASAPATLGLALLSLAWMFRRSKKA